MANKRKQFTKGINLRADSTALDVDGDIKHDSADNKLKARLNSSDKEIITNDQTQTLTNKTIDADSNTISNLEVDNLKAGVLDTDLTAVSGADDTIPSALAVKTYVDAQVATKDEASEISYSNATSGLTATDVQAAIDEVEARVDNSDAHIAASTNVHGIGASASVVGTDTTQTLTNKTIDADSNTITNIENADIKALAAIDATKIADGSVTSTEFQYLANVTSDIQTQINGKLTTATLTDNHIVRADGTSAVQDSGLIIDDSDVLSGATQLNVDNLRLDGNTLSSTDTNGNINLTPDGAGLVVISTVDINAGTINDVDIDGGTASNTHRLTVPKDTKTNLDALTRKEATLLYATDEDKLYYDDGSSLFKVGGNALASTDPSSIKTTDYNILSTDDGSVILVDSSGGTVNVTLPDPSTVFRVTVKDATGGASSFSINILLNGTEEIDGVVGNDVIDEAYKAHSYISNGTNWFRIASFSGVAIQSLGTGLFGGGSGPSNVIDYVSIPTASNATDFGDLTVSRDTLAACASGTRGLFGGGTSNSNVIDYVTIATTGNATDFGDLTVGRTDLAGCSSSTRGLFGGGGGGNVIDYVTIATTGNATDFGDLSVARDILGACSSSTRGLFGGGTTTSNVIDYVTIASTGNATDFGDLTVGRRGAAGCASDTRGLFGGGNDGASSNVIDYVTIASTGNATDFGDLTAARQVVAACSSKLRGLWGGGSVPPSSNVIDYITIASTGNATDFGDLTVARFSLAGCSDAHGGI